MEPRFRELHRDKLRGAPFVSLFKETDIRPDLNQPGIQNQGRLF